MELHRLHANTDLVVSMEITERLEVLNQRVNQLRSELAASNREEKKLRATNVRLSFIFLSFLFCLLEYSRVRLPKPRQKAEVAKVSRTLELSKQPYLSLQKQYQEQCC